jgi:hypothetical protein
MCLYIKGGAWYGFIQCGLGQREATWDTHREEQNETMQMVVDMASKSGQDGHLGKTLEIHSNRETEEP